MTLQIVTMNKFAGESAENATLAGLETDNRGGMGVIK